MTAILIVSQPVLCFKVCPVTVLLRLHYSLVTGECIANKNAAVFRLRRARMS